MSNMINLEKFAGGALTEIRCKHCGKLLAKVVVAKNLEIEILCNRCKTKNNYKINKK